MTYYYCNLIITIVKLLMTILIKSLLQLLTVETMDGLIQGTSNRKRESNDGDFPVRSWNHGGETRDWIPTNPMKYGETQGRIHVLKSDVVEVSPLIYPRFMLENARNAACLCSFDAY